MIVVHGEGELSFPPTFLFLSINQAVGSMASWQSEARSNLALRLLYQEPKAKRGRLQNKEDAIMDWTLLTIVTLTDSLGIFALYRIWKERH